MKNGLIRNSIASMVEDKKGNMWFGTSSGLSRFDGKTFQCFSTKDGLTNNSVWSILEDKSGDLWIDTRNTGLSRYDGKTITRFSE